MMTIYLQCGHAMYQQIGYGVKERPGKCPVCDGLVREHVPINHQQCDERRWVDESGKACYGDWSFWEGVIGGAS